MDIVELIKAFILGIIQGITEWLPISSTGHMILFNSFLPLDSSRYSGGVEFIELFMTIIQFGSILAVILLFFEKLNPFSKSKSSLEKRDTFVLWIKVLIGSIPAAIIGLIFKDQIHKYLYNGLIVAFMLILYGIFFILVENRNSGIKPRISMLNKLDYKTAFLIGIFQALALVPGTSRSGATILGALLLGCSRYIGAEFSFFLAIPTMFGASLLEICSYFKHYGVGFSHNEWGVLLIGFVVAFIVSIFAISLLMKFIKSHSFKSFAWYRILLGIIVVIMFMTGFLNMSA